MGGGGPNCTPTVAGDLVFALGRDGDLLCAESATGKVVWRKNFGRDFGGRMMSGWLQRVAARGRGSADLHAREQQGHDRGPRQ